MSRSLSMFGTFTIAVDGSDQLSRGTDPRQHGTRELIYFLLLLRH